MVKKINKETLDDAMHRRGVRTYAEAAHALGISPTYVKTAPSRLWQKKKRNY